MVERTYSGVPVSLSTRRNNLYEVYILTCSVLWGFQAQLVRAQLCYFSDRPGCGGGRGRRYFFLGGLCGVY